MSKNLVYPYNKVPPLQQIFSIPQVAVVLGVSANTVRKIMVDGTFTPKLYVGVLSRKSIKRSELWEYIDGLEAWPRNPDGTHVKTPSNLDDGDNRKTKVQV
jgi:hypothetical protein